MTDLTVTNNDYAQRLYKAATLSETEAALKAKNKEDATSSSQRAAPPKSKADVAESFELGVLPQQKPLNLKDAALYKDMLRQLPISRNFDMSEVMSVIYQSLTALMRSQSKARMVDLDLAGEADKMAAQKMKSAAAIELGGAVLGASMQLAGAGMTMAGTAYSAKAENTMEFNQMMKPFNAGSEMLSSSGSVLKSGLEYSGKVQSANAELDKSTATRAHSLREQDDELYKEAQKFIEQMLQIIQSIASQQHAASSQILSA